MQLSFDHGEFILTKPGIKEPRHLAHWKWSGKETWVTTNLKAASAYRKFSDEIAEKVFNRSFTKFYDTPWLPPLSFLDPHQREGVEWILSRSRSYLAHAPGAGKTCQTIVASLLLLSARPALFIVPPTLTLNWERETNRFSNLMGIYTTVSIVPKSTKEFIMNWGADFIICPDSMITKDWVYEKLLHLKPRLIAVDEASRFKEPFSQRSKAFYGGKINEKTYPGLFQDCPHTVFLDGSPLLNRSMELWAPTYCLNPMAIDCMEYYDFGFKYGGPVLTKFGNYEFKGNTNQDELRERLQKDFMHVVPESSLNHPERRRSLVYMNEDVRSKDVKAWEQKNVKNLRLNDIKEGADRGDLAEIRFKIGMQKVPWVVKYIKERFEARPQSILLFAWHREVCEELCEGLEEFNPALVYGGTKSVERERSIKEFNSGKRQLLVGNIQSLGRGHNIQRADRVTFAEYSWTDELNKQCEKRSSRRGNNKSHIRCEYIVLPNSIDELVLQSVFRKEKAVKKVIGV